MGAPRGPSGPGWLTGPGVFPAPADGLCADRIGAEGASPAQPGRLPSLGSVLRWPLKSICPTPTTIKKKRWSSSSSRGHGTKELWRSRLCPPTAHAQTRPPPGVSGLPHAHSLFPGEARERACVGAVKVSPSLLALIPRYPWDSASRHPPSCLPYVLCTPRLISLICRELGHSNGVGLDTGVHRASTT